MKKIKKTTAIALLFALSALTSFSQSETPPEQLTVPLSSPGKSYTLKVNLVEGSIKVTGYSGKDVMIEVSAPDRKARKIKEGDAGMKRLSTTGSYEVTAKESNNVVTVGTDNPNRTVNLTLKIPQDVKLQLSTVNNGVIEVTDVKGELEIEDVNSSITLKNISGSVVANTVNGGVTASFLSVDPKAAMAFSTLNGNINVTFPADTKASLKLKSDRGEIFSDFDVDLDKTLSKPVKTTEDGMYKLKKEDWVNGKINGGGPEMMMKNMNGGIYIRKTK